MSTGLIARRAPICAAFVVAVIPAAWCQQPSPESQQAAPQQLEQIIVTASRVPEPEDQSFFSVTVLTRADIEDKFLLNARHGGWTAERADEVLKSLATLFDRPVELTALRG